MKRILVALSVVCFLSTTAHAVTRWSYNPSTFSPIKVLAQWYHGWNTKSIVYTYEPCLVVTVNYYAFGVLVNTERTEFPCGK